MSEWRFILANSSDMSPIAELRNASNKRISPVLNRPGRASLTLPMSDPIAVNIQPVTHCLICTYNGVIKWSGPIWTIEDSCPADQVNVTAMGWMELLYHRILRTKTPYVAQTRGTIIHSLLGAANTQQPTWLVPGTQDDDANPINITFEKDSTNIGQAIEGLTNLEAGPDVFVDPATRAVNIRQWDGFVNRPEVTFSYGLGPDNLSAVTRNIDPSQMCNRITVYGKNNGVTPALVEDLVSQANRRLFEETVTLSEIVDTNVLGAYANVEVMLRTIPRETYSITPRYGGPEVPMLWTDFELGDKVQLMIKRAPRMLVDISIRVFSVEISIDNEGNQKMDSLTLYAGAA